MIREAVPRPLKVEPGRTVRVLSLGAGVQSSTLALLYHEGILAPKPSFAIFADTGAESEEVYRWFDYLRGVITSFPLLLTKKGDIDNDVLSNGRFASPPFFIRNKEGKMGMTRRQCTREYKVDEIKRAVKELLGYKPRKHVRHKVEMIIGISTDEITRTRESGTKWIENIYPLIDELSWSRHDCLEYWERNSLPAPPRSSCYFCPYHSKEEWLHLKKNDPDSWKRAVEFDRRIREKDTNFIGDLYLHKEGRPLDTIDFEKHEEQEPSGEECEGYCFL